MQTVDHGCVSFFTLSKNPAESTSRRYASGCRDFACAGPLARQPAEPQSTRFACVTPSPPRARCTRRKTPGFHSAGAGLLDAEGQGASPASVRDIAAREQPCRDSIRLLRCREPIRSSAVRQASAPPRHSGRGRRPAAERHHPPLAGGEVTDGGSPRKGPAGSPARRGPDRPAAGDRRRAGDRGL